MRTTAGMYRRKINCLGVKASEIILSKPVLENLPEKALISSLCNEMIHACLILFSKLKKLMGKIFVNAWLKSILRKLISK